RLRVDHALGRFEWAFFARSRASDSLHILTAEIERAGSAAYYFIELAMGAAIALVYFVLAFRLSPAITAGVAAFGLVLAMAMYRHLVAARRSGERLSTGVEGLYAAIAEHLGSLKAAMRYGAVDRHEESFGRLSCGVRDVRVAAAYDYGRFRQRMALGSAAGLA